MGLFLRRRRFIVNRRLQFRLLVSSLSYVLFFLLVIAASLFVPPALKMWSVELDSQDAIESSVQFLHLHRQFWPAAALALIAISLHSILMSHRIAGPLYRLQQVLSKLKKGVFPRSHAVRKTDLIVDEIKLLNETVDSLWTTVAELKSNSEELQLALTELNNESDTPTTATQRVLDAGSVLEKNLANLRNE